MATYKIDINRGNDSNNGTSAPWQNVSKLASQALSSGDQVLLARDSIWNISSHVFMAAVAGTAASPVYIGADDTGLEKTAKPQINLTFSIAAGSWTYEASSNGWYATLTYGIGKLSLILCGGALGYFQETFAATTVPLQSSSGFWGLGGSGGVRLYIYAPAGTDPTTYYGSVVVGPCYRAGLFFSNVGTDVFIENLSSLNAAAPVGAWSSTGGHRFQARNISLAGCAAMSFQSDKAGSGSNIVVIDGLTAVNQPSAGVAFVEGGSGSNLFTSVIVRHARMTDGGLAYGSAGVYIQSHATVVEDSYFARMRYGSPGTAQDGCAVYADLSADGTVVRRNTFEDCAVATQQGSCPVATFESNLYLNCGCAMKVTNGGIPTVENRFYNNTVINALTPHSTYGGVAQCNGAWWSYAANVKADVRNNTFTACPGQTGPCFSEYKNGYYAGSVIDTNAAYGFGALTGISFNEGGSPPITPTNTATGDPMVTSSGRPLPNSPLLGAGTYISTVTRDFDLKQRRNPPAIGAFDQATFRHS